MSIIAVVMDFLTGRADDFPVLVGVADEVGVGAAPALAGGAAGRAGLVLKVLKILRVQLVRHARPVRRRLRRQGIPVQAGKEGVRLQKHTKPCSGFKVQTSAVKSDKVEQLSCMQGANGRQRTLTS